MYHLLDLEGLKKIAPDVSWDVYLDSLGFPSIVSINVAEPDFVKEFDAMAKSTDLGEWRAYLRWHLAASASPWLSERFVAEWFHFRQVLTGTKVLQPRWKRCVRFADQWMGEALAQPFVRETLGEDGKRTAEQMVAGIEESMKGDIESLSWMDDATRLKAETEAREDHQQDRFSREVAQLRRARDRSVVVRAECRACDTVRSATPARESGQTRRQGRVGNNSADGQCDYEPTMNEMVFPAGIHQPPSTQHSGRAVELRRDRDGGRPRAHDGFDDEGRQFDAEGNLRDWWSPAVAAEFDKRAKCVERQFDEYVPIDDAHIKGKLTLGENIADLGGVKLSFATFERAEKTHPTATVPGGFTPEQQFFLGFAQSWCANYRPESLRLLVATNPHSPPKFRVNGPLSNVGEFAAAFQCKEGSPMVRGGHARDHAAKCGDPPRAQYSAPLNGTQLRWVRLRCRLALHYKTVSLGFAPNRQSPPGD